MSYRTYILEGRPIVSTWVYNPFLLNFYVITAMNEEGWEGECISQGDFTRFGRCGSVLWGSNSLT